MHTYYASEYAILDSDVVFGGGTDDTASQMAIGTWKDVQRH